MLPTVQFFTAADFLAEVRSGDTVRIQTYATSRRSGKEIVFVHLEIGAHATKLHRLHAGDELHSLWLPTHEVTAPKPLFNEAVEAKVDEGIGNALQLAQRLGAEIERKGGSVRTGRYDVGVETLVSADWPGAPENER
ncbi:MAG: hypothetical protein H0X69_15795 [Gemmatimonadales bacterium]|nr:hypothetical protein [Gemmatimonadales bacterium]